MIGLYLSLCSLIQVYGAVMNINRGNPFQKEVVLDSWPHFKAVITRQKKEVVLKGNNNNNKKCWRQLERLGKSAIITITVIL